MFAACSADPPPPVAPAPRALLFPDRGERVSFARIAEGKGNQSLLLQPLAAVLGEDYVQEGLATGQFPLLGLESKRAVVLNEWHFNASILPLPVQLLASPTSSSFTSVKCKPVRRATLGQVWLAQVWQWSPQPTAPASHSFSRPLMN